MSRGGSLMKWRGECGHWFVVLSLEPTPLVCPDCADAQRRVLADVHRAFDFGDIDDLPSQDELDEWLDECGVADPQVRSDIRELAAIGDEVRDIIAHGELVARKMLVKYPAAERLSMESA